MPATAHTTPDFAAVAGGTEHKSLVFDADLGTVGDLDIDAAEFVRYYKPSYKNGQLCLRLTLPALVTILNITSAHKVTHENLSVIPAQYNTLKLIEEDIEKGRKSWNPWKKFDAKRKIPLFVSAAQSLLSLTAMTSQEIARTVNMISTKETERISVDDISPMERVGKVVVPLEGLHAEELSTSLNEYMEWRQSSDSQGPNATEDGHEDEFSDNASTIRPSTSQRNYQAASNSSTPSISPSVGPQEDTILASTTPSGTRSVTDTGGVGVSFPAGAVFVTIIEKFYHKCMVANDSANLGTSTFNNDISSSPGSGHSSQGSPTS